jgi:hypothetical protein
MKIRLAFTLLAAAACFGCTKKTESAGISSENRYYSGDLAAALDKQYGSKDNNLDDFCEVTMKARKYEVAAELAKHQAAIDQYNQELIKTPSIATLQKIGSFQFYDLTPEPQQDKWTREEPTGWPLLFAEVEWAKRQNTPKGWAYIDKYVREMIPDDDDRIMEWRNQSIEREDAAPLGMLKSLVDRCVESSCTSLAVPDDLAKWARTKWFYKWHLDRLNTDNFKDNLLHWQRRINMDYARFNPTLNTLI